MINAANIDKDVEWIKRNAEGFNCEVVDESPKYGEVAIQGPKAEETVEKVLGLSVKDIPFYNFQTFEIDGEEVIVSRTGYTGEDGFEVYGPRLHPERMGQADGSRRAALRTRLPRHSPL